MADELQSFTSWARGWLFQAALPLWWEVGADRAGGGFHEKIGLDGTPVAARKRLRVQARQVFVFGEAGRLGWDGPWREAMAHGLEFLLAAYRRDDGLFRTAAPGGGEAGSDEADLYDQAFVFLALATAYARLGRDAVFIAEAKALLAILQDRFAHPGGGFRETGSMPLPLRSNPHMHMLEAMLAWTATGDGPEFRATARQIVDLATTRLIDGVSGSVGEYFDDTWHPAAGEAGHLREPGHQYEWAFLLNRADALLDTSTRYAASQLLRFAERCGIRDGRAIFSVTDEGVSIDASSRLWAQTERLRAMFLLEPSGQGRVAATQSAALLRRFLDVPVPGLWTDRITADGEWLVEPAPASSFYHIMTALTPLFEAEDALARPGALP